MMFARFGQTVPAARLGRTRAAVASAQPGHCFEHGALGSGGNLLIGADHMPLADSRIAARFQFALSNPRG